jgi:hypothetical protein
LTDNLLDELDDNNTPDETFDLLDNLTEVSGKSWAPAKDPECPRGIQGKVTSVFTVDSDYSGSCPALSIEDAEGDEWVIRGFHSILRSELEDRDPQIGDTFAVKYFGQREPAKKGQQGAHVYKVAVRRK